MSQTKYEVYYEDLEKILEGLELLNWMVHQILSNEVYEEEEESSCQEDRAPSIGELTT